VVISFVVSGVVVGVSDVVVILGWQVDLVLRLSKPRFQRSMVHSNPSQQVSHLLHSYPSGTHVGAALVVASVVVSGLGVVLDFSVVVVIGWQVDLKLRAAKESPRFHRVDVHS
jgi:hypothetical protein